MMNLWKIKTERELKSSTKTDLQTKAVKELRNNGYSAHKVDYFDSRTQRQHDLLGIADILAWRCYGPTLLIQVCAKSSLSARRNKIKASLKAKEWLGLNDSKKHRGIYLMYFWKESNLWRWDFEVVLDV